MRTRGGEERECTVVPTTYFRGENVRIRENEHDNGEKIKVALQLLAVRLTSTASWARRELLDALFCRNEI